MQSIQCVALGCQGIGITASSIGVVFNPIGIADIRLGGDAKRRIPRITRVRPPRSRTRPRNPTVRLDSF